MHTNIKELDEKFQKSDSSIRHEIEAKASIMARNLTSFEEKFERDTKIRLQEEKAIEDQLDAHALHLQARFNSLLTQREICFQSIRSKLDFISEAQSRKASQLQDFVSRETSRLVNSLRTESSVTCHYLHITTNRNEREMTMKFQTRSIPTCRNCKHL